VAPGSRQNSDPICSLSERAEGSCTHPIMTNKGYHRTAHTKVLHDPMKRYRGFWENEDLVGYSSRCQNLRLRIHNKHTFIHS
jgi:hypothetical protein